MELAYVDAKKEEFDTLDKDHDGKVSLAEYEEHFHEASSKNEKSRTAYFAKVFEDFDEDFNMALSRDELERVLAERFLVKPRENFPKLFFKFDVDKSGGLDLTGESSDKNLYYSHLPAEYMKFDAEFPFDQTDPVGGGPSKTNTHHNQMHTEVPQDADAAAIAAVLAQASPTLNKTPAGGASRINEAGFHPVSPGAIQPSVPIKKV
uniref:EF-hand domain-containing protein n=1 Tax=Caenorhabditis tropicalis TaxID=1561998 RepID=A0A1I7TFY5_9PELO